MSRQRTTCLVMPRYDFAKRIMSNPKSARLMDEYQRSTHVAVADAARKAIESHRWGEFKRGLLRGGHAANASADAYARSIEGTQDAQQLLAKELTKRMLRLELRAPMPRRVASACHVGSSGDGEPISGAP